MKVSNARGFTVLELLVSTMLISLILMMLVGYILNLQRNFLDDVVRTRINSNLRTAMDIISMNIRQTGENLGSTFPALLLTTDNDGVGQRLILRRNLLSEVLTLCESASSGTTTLYISTTSGPSPSCVYTNVESLYNAFSNFRGDKGGEVKLFIYNSLTRTGSYVDYSTEGTSSGKYYLTVSPIPTNYSAGTTYLYLIEEYDFFLDETTKTLNLIRESEEGEIEPVAFSVTDLAFSLRMQDNTIVTALSAIDTHTWKDLDYVTISLTGSEERKNNTFTTSISANYYPRNVLSR